MDRASEKDGGGVMFVYKKELMNMIKVVRLMMTISYNAVGIGAYA